MDRMREIKFRAWDGNLMHYGMPGFYFEPDGCVLINYIQINAESYTKSTIMQYTGLKDANGQEMYQGDIVEHITAKHRDVIVWDDGAFAIRREGWEWRLKGRNHKLVAIGNIHENPELLEQQP